MKRKTAIGGLLLMGVMIAMATLALVYGNWAQRFAINGTVQTGTVNVKALRICGPLEDPPCAFDNEGEGAKVTKDVGQCALTQDGKKFTLTITNGYPGYKCHFWIDIVNNGKLPVTVRHRISELPQGIKVTPVADGDWNPVDNGYPPLPEGGTFPKGDCTADQLNQGGITFCDFDVQVNKNAEQGQDLSFSIDVLAELLNKPPAANGS